MLLPNWEGLPLITPIPTTAECEPHTPHPAGFLVHVDWVAELTKAGYRQRQCRGCRRWLIWEKPEEEKS